jgi:hypothetical protein
MLKAKALPGVFWGEAVTTAVYLLNRTSCKAIRGRTPYELWTRSASTVHHLHTFGCVAHIKVTAPNQKKLDDRSRRMIFVGYEPGSKAYRVYDPTTRRVHISHDVIFDEAAQWAWANEHDVDPDGFVIEESEPQEPAVITTSSSMTRAPPLEPALGSASSSASTSSPPPSLDRPTATPTPSSPASAAPSTAPKHLIDFASPSGSSVSTTSSGRPHH